MIFFFSPICNYKALYRRRRTYKGGSLLFFSGHSECGICINAIFAIVSNVCIKQLMFFKNVSLNIAPTEEIVNTKVLQTKISAAASFGLAYFCSAAPVARFLAELVSAYFSSVISTPCRRRIYQISVNRAKI